MQAKETKEVIPGYFARMKTSDTTILTLIFGITS